MPMNLAQCNAMISLVDNDYYKRSWCCIETLMVQTLKNAYGKHFWYEHIVHPVSGVEYLRDGPLDMVIDLATKQVSYESDRQKILFLERQTKLMG